MELEMKLTKIYDNLESKQSPRLQSYIDFNGEKKNAPKNFEKNYLN